MNPLYFSTRLLISILTVVTISFSSALQAEPLPLAPYKAQYKVYLKGCPAGESLHQLSCLSNGHYRYVTRTQPYLNIVPYRYFASSTFQFEKDLIVPKNYSYNSQEMRRSKKGEVWFDWKNQQLENRYTLPNWEAPLIKGMQDKLTHSLQLRIDLIQGKQKDLEYTVVEESKTLAYSFSVLGRETLVTSLGKLNTLKIKHIDHKKQVTLTWLALDYEYLPIKMEHYRHGKKVGNGEIVAYTQSN